MLSQETAAQSWQIQTWPIDRLVLYARNPRKNDAAVDRMCSSIREFGFKIPVLARSDGEVVDGHLRLKASRKLGITEVPLSSAVPHDDPALDRILDDVHESFCRQLSQPDRESLTTELERIVSDAERSR